MTNHKVLGEDQLLIRWLHNEKEDLVQKAEAKYQSNAAKAVNHLVSPETRKLLLKLIFLVWADPKVFDGRAILSGDTDRHGQLTSSVVSGATLINAMTNAPILLYAFAFAGSSALALSTSLNVVILWWTNQVGTTAASRKQGNRLWSITGAFAFLAMSTVQSLVAGIGAELTNNQAGISAMKAELVAQEYIDTLEQSYEDWSMRSQQRCDEAIASLNSDDKSYFDVYGGTYAQTVSGELQNENAPCTPESLEQYSEEIATASAAFESAERQRISLNHDMEFIKSVGLYDQHFYPKTVNSGTPDVRTIDMLHSGPEAITLASESFFASLGAASDRFKAAIGSGDNPTDEDNADSPPAINMAIFFFSLSVITSFAATALIIAHSFKQDTQMSHSKKVEESVSYWLESVRRQYAQRVAYEEGEGQHKEEEIKQQKVNQKLLSLYIDEYRETGKCDYPKVQAIAKLSQEGMDVRLIQDGQSLIADIDAAYHSIDTASTHLIKHFFRVRKQEPKKEGLFGAVKDFFVGEKSVNDTATDSSQDSKENDLVKNNLAILRQGVTRLVLLSNRYAAAIYLSGDNEYYRAIKTLEKQIRDNMQLIKTMSFNTPERHQIKAASMVKAVDDLPSQLVQLQTDCVELKEITQEEIKNKLITLFQSEEDDTQTVVRT